MSFPTRWHPIAQRLETFIEEVKADGSTSHLLRLGVLNSRNMNEAHLKKDHLERCYWQLAQITVACILTHTCDNP